MNRAGAIRTAIQTGALAIALAAAGCGGDDDAGDGDGGLDGGADGDGGGGACLAPVDEPAWLAADLARYVGDLAAAPRASAAQRAATRAYLVTELEALGYAPRLATYESGANVVAELTATVATDTWLVLGAHFDSVTDSPGANDNATGVAIVLATARALRSVSCRDHHLALVLFDQEEVGLIGSGVYAAAARQAGVDIVAAHTIDQAGWDMDDDLRFEIERPTAALFAQYQAAAAAVGAQVVSTQIGTTDHQSFRDQGYAAAGLTEEYVSGDTTPHYHLPGDVAATVDGPYHRVAARLVIHVLARALGAPPP